MTGSGKKIRMDAYLGTILKSNRCVGGKDCRNDVEAGGKPQKFADAIVRRPVDVARQAE